MKKKPILSFGTVVSIGVAIIVTTIVYFSLFLGEGDSARASLIRRTNETCRQMGGSVRQWDASRRRECQLPGGPLYYLDVKLGRWVMPDLRRGTGTPFPGQPSNGFDSADSRQSIQQGQPQPPQPHLTISSSTKPGWLVASTKDFSIEYPDGWYARDFGSIYDGGNPKSSTITSGYIYSYDYYLENPGRPLTADKLRVYFEYYPNTDGVPLLEKQRKSVPRLEELDPIVVSGYQVKKYLVYGEDTFDQFTGDEAYTPYYSLITNATEYLFSCDLGNSNLIGWCERIVKTFKLVGTSRAALCTGYGPANMLRGRYDLPIDETKYGSLNLLGQLFTADDCGPARLREAVGVYESGTVPMYGEGVHLVLRSDPTADIRRVMEGIGFTRGSCVANLPDSSCRSWILRESVPVESILKLKGFATEIESDDCVNCG